MKIVTAAQMIELDLRTIREAGISEKTLIARAGKAVADWIGARYSPRAHRVLALAGKGNNGADARVAARHLRQAGFRAHVLPSWKPDALDSLQAEISRGRLAFRLLILDGLFGTGLNRPVSGVFLAMINLLRSSGVEMISLDLPSGLHADTGAPLGSAVAAQTTLTFGLPKLGLIQEHAAPDVGALHVLDIGFPSHLVSEIRTPYELLVPEEMAALVPSRRRNAHKGDCGHVLVVGGSAGFAGAPAMAARAALRAGAGLVSLVVPASIYSVAATLAGAEIMTHPVGNARAGGKEFDPRSLSKIQFLLERADALVIGPGLGQGRAARVLVETLIRSSPKPILLDADGLNVIAARPDVLLQSCKLSRQAQREIVITPHPGEMARLTGLDAAEVGKRRFEVAGAFAEKYGVTVVLKGARTLVAHPEPVMPAGCPMNNRTRGGIRFSVNALAGNPGMATGGCGDALAGVIGALLARGLSAADAARAGVFLHARAGDLAMPAMGGGIAGDIIEALPQALALFSVPVFACQSTQGHGPL